MTRSGDEGSAADVLAEEWHVQMWLPAGVSGASARTATRGVDVGLRGAVAQLEVTLSTIDEPLQLSISR